MLQHLVHQIVFRLQGRTLHEKPLLAKLHLKQVWKIWTKKNHVQPKNSLERTKKTQTWKIREAGRGNKLDQGRGLKPQIWDLLLGLVVCHHHHVVEQVEPKHIALEPELFWRVLHLLQVLHIKLQQERPMRCHQALPWYRNGC